MRDGLQNGKFKEVFLVILYKFMTDYVFTQIKRLQND